MSGPSVGSAPGSGGHSRGTVPRAARDPAATGWERRFVGAPPRLREHVELYESLGLEVRLEPVPEGELAPECAGCALALTLFRVIYTRRRA